MPKVSSEDVFYSFSSLSPKKTLGSPMCVHVFKDCIVNLSIDSDAMAKYAFFNKTPFIRFLQYFKMDRCQNRHEVEVCEPYVYKKKCV